MAEKFESRREPGDSNRVLGNPKAAAWVVVVVLVLIVFVAFGTLRSRAPRATDGARAGNPSHGAQCPDVSVPNLNRMAMCSGSSEPEDQPDSR